MIWAVLVYPLFVWFVALLGAWGVVIAEVVRDTGSKWVIPICILPTFAIIVAVILLAISERSPGLAVLGISIVLILASYGTIAYADLTSG